MNYGYWEDKVDDLIEAIAQEPLATANEVRGCYADLADRLSRAAAQVEEL